MTITFISGIAMKKIPGANFIKQVVDLFREDNDTSISRQQDNSRSAPDTRYGGDSARPAGGSLKGHPSDKARESNIDRYRHPSDFSRSGY